MDIPCLELSCHRRQQKMYFRSQQKECYSVFTFHCVTLVLETNLLFAYLNFLVLFAKLFVFITIAVGKTENTYSILIKLFQNLKSKNKL